MDTYAYKTRSWWAVRGLSFAHSAVDYQAPRSCVSPVASDPSVTWGLLANECLANACADNGAECLTRTYVDRQGNLLPEYVV